MKKNAFVVHLNEENKIGAVIVMKDYQNATLVKNEWNFILKNQNKTKRM